MTRALLLVSLCVLAAACGSTTTTAPTQPVQVIAPPAPAPIAAANFLYGDGTLLCVRGFCSSFTMSMTNLGPGCARNMQVIVSWYGSDGAIPLPNTPSITMGYAGGLTNVLFRPGTTIVLESLGGFNDVRSAHTVYRATGSWTNVAC